MVALYFSRSRRASSVRVASSCGLGAGRRSCARAIGAPQRSTTAAVPTVHRSMRMRASRDATLPRAPRPWEAAALRRARLQAVGVGHDLGVAEHHGPAAHLVLGLA